MTPRDIKLLLQLRNIEHQKLARELGCSKSELSQVINGHRQNTPLRTKLAARLGMPEDELFGANHDEATEDKRAKDIAAA